MQFPIRMQSAWNRRIVVWTFFALVFPFLPDCHPLNAGQVEESREQYARALQNWVDVLELQIEELERLEGLGTVTEGERDFNQAQLAAINYELAKLEGKRQVAEPHLQDFIDIEKRRLARLKPLRRLNAVPAITMTHVRSGLHFGQFHMAQFNDQTPEVIKHLEEFAKLSEQEVASYQQAVQSNSVSPCEVSVAHHQLLFARYLLGKRQDNLEEILPEIRRINTLLENDWLAAEVLHKRRLITLLDAYFMELYYLESQLLIAAIESSQDSMADLLQQRVALHNRVLQKGRSLGWGPILPVNFQLNLENLLSCSAAFDQFLHDRLRATGEFEYESMLLFGL
jgi:hypothetical protein